MLNICRNKLLNYISENGYIRFDQYMDLALYDKDVGYYMNNDPIGINGSFTTAPEISALFGLTLATWILYQWEKLDYPENLNLIELGAGHGTLMKDILHATCKIEKFYKNLNINIVEISPVLINIQKNNLKDYNINWHKKIPTEFDGPVIFIANEFFDALPMRQFQYEGNIYLENIICNSNNKLFWNTKEISDTCDLIDIKKQIYP